jgi:hypothetical protein
MIKIEAQLQAKMVIEFSQKRPEERGRLFGYFAETSSPVQGAQMLSLGLIRGVSDLIYIDDYKRIVGIEVKAKGSSHSVKHLKEQAEWLINCCHRGCFCDSLDMFWDIINGCIGYHPEFILKRLDNIKTKNVLWDKIIL